MQWNDTDMPYPEHKCIHQLFEEKVVRTPEAIAVVYEDQILSYAELNAHANRLAHQLIELGVRPDEPVAICVGRSLEMVVGLLAILKAGGVNVPLDPTLPLERLGRILKDAAPSVMLADEIGRAALGESTLAQLTVLDPNMLLDSSSSNPHVIGLTSRHLAYVIYTSGSTGIPKGVMLEHRGIVNLIQDQISCCGVNASSRLLQFATFGFDVSISEIFGALGSGASLYIPSNIVRLNRYELWNYMEKYAITHAVFSPALLQNGNDLPTLSNPLTLLLTGEAPRAALLESLLKHGVVFNAYGTTETSIWSTTWRCSPEISNGVVTMGQPISNTRIYILDPYGHPVPLGAIGELYVGGVGVARGYLNRPELTAERFSQDPFTKDIGSRMYKTGDLARHLPNGNIEFLGRNDSQVKIRGHRIELEEIEAHLVEHPQVREAAVLALGDEGDKRLVAYVVAAQEEYLTRILRSYLALKVPEYMLPTAFVRMDALPLTSSCKLNRRALPPPDIESFAHKAYEAPKGEIEIMLAKIWSDLLGLERVSRHDNFSELGGHSLLAVRMISHIRERLGKNVGLRVLLEAPSLVELAEMIQVKHDDESNQFDVLLPIQVNDNRPPLFCIHPVIGLSWSYISLSKHLGSKQPIYGLQARGFNDNEPLPETIEAMALDYLDQIRKIQPTGPYYLLGWSFGGSIAHCIAILLQQQNEIVALLALMDSPIDYTRLKKLPNMEQLINYLNIPGYSADKKQFQNWDEVLSAPFLWKYGFF
ncbi:hypothetical protein K7432_016790 [Basidiobolus ranarum]|uniref:Carrier domain-containing protein n=1 Tax=Basidiobolus ranarum TaxID=34480 RepID=A0ABR2VL59_9FUNG